MNRTKLFPATQHSAIIYLPDLFMSFMGMHSTATHTTLLKWKRYKTSKSVGWRLRDNSSFSTFPRRRVQQYNLSFLANMKKNNPAKTTRELNRNFMIFIRQPRNITPATINLRSLSEVTLRSRI